MHRNDRARPRRHARADGRGIEIERRRIDVDEHRCGANPRDAAGGREERIRAGDDLVAGPDAQRHRPQAARRFPTTPQSPAGTSRYDASSRSSASTSGPMMNRWLSQTRVIAARISSRSGRYCASRSRSGTGVRVAGRSSDHDFRRRKQRAYRCARRLALPGTLLLVLKMTSTSSPA